MDKRGNKRISREIRREDLGKEGRNGSTMLGAVEDNSGGS